MRKGEIATFLLLAAAVGAEAQTPPDISDLINARAPGGETQLEARGYRQITTNVVRDTKWSFWWSDRRRQCISVATMDGRYTSLNVVPAANCDGASDGGERRGADDRYPSRSSRISLVCIGSGSGPAAQSNSGYRYNSRTRKFEYETGTTLGREAFASDVELEISDGSGRIRPTGKLISPLHSGGVEGWWPVGSLIVTPDRITGEYRMNGLNKPRIDYNRRTRLIHISAATDFTGRCEEQ